MLRSDVHNHFITNNNEVPGLRNKIIRACNLCGFLKTRLKIMQINNGCKMVLGTRRILRLFLSSKTFGVEVVAVGSFLCSKGMHLSDFSLPDLLFFHFFHAFGAKDLLLNFYYQSRRFGRDWRLGSYFEHI